MAMAAADPAAKEILPQLDALLADRLQVLSYKWLSRTFAVPSNTAKRLLQEFADKHGNELHVIYAVSGWLKNDHHIYCVKLASGPKLLEVKQEFKDPCSAQVYSVQLCIPKDTALLWNTEFTQTEELFKRPHSENNCLRDNRFCGVSNSFVTWTADSSKPNSDAPKPVNVTTKVENQFKSSGTSRGKHPSPRKVAPSCMEDEISKKSEKESLVNQASLVQRSAANRDAAKINEQTEKPSGGNIGSLANLWGRAPARPKPSKNTYDDPTAASEVAVTAEAQICAQEAADVASSDDDKELCCKRESSSNRKRRVFFDYSDDDEENVISLASPDLPKHAAISDTKDNIETDFTGKDNGISAKAIVKNEKFNNATGISLIEKVHTGSTDNVGQSINPSSTSPKRRKVLKTRIDERGREVSEFVWEGEVPRSESHDNNVPNNENENRTNIQKKPQASGASGRNPAANKPSAAKMSTKANAKDAKQGNILSFFKKM